MAFVAPFLMGAIGEVQRQRQETDDITGKIVDTVAPYILNKIFDAEKLSEKQTKLFNGYSNRYGANFAQVIANANLLESGDEKEADLLIKNYFGTDDLLSVKKMVDEKAKDSKSFQKLFGQNPITARQRSIKDKKEFINEQFSDRANLKRLMIDPEQKRSGLSGFLFGDRIRQEDVPGATQRLAEGLQIPTTELAGTPSQDISTFLGIKPLTDLSFTELQQRTDAASRQRVNSIMADAEKAFDRRKIYANVYSGNKKFKAEFDKIQKEYKARTGNEYPLDITDYAFKKFLPSFVETFSGISYYPTTATTTTTQPAAVAKTTKVEKPAQAISPFKTQVTAKPGTPKFRLEVQERVNEMQQKMSGIEPEQLVAYANQRIVELEKNASESYDPSQDIEVIKATTRLQLQNLRVDPRTYGY